MALIYISTAEGEAQPYRLPDTPGVEVLIGRSEDCQIPLPQVNGVSGVHCSLYFDGNQYYIIDRQSTNGVFCNGERIENAILKRGDVYSIGEATLVFDPEIAVAAPSVQAPPSHTTGTGAAPARRRRPAGPSVSAASLGSSVPQYQVKKPSAAVQIFTVLYVIVMLGAAFYAGMVLRHWNETGTIFLPWIDPAPPTAAPEATPRA